MRFDKEKVSIIIPTKNEGEGLRKVITSLKSYANEIIVIDGHSTDNTQDIIKKTNARYVLDHGKGRGDAVRLGIEISKGEVLVFVDGDGSHLVRDIPRLIGPIFENQADLVIGSRRTGGSFDLNMSFDGILRSGGADFLAYLINRKFKTHLSDILYSFRAVRRNAALKLNLVSNDFRIEQEMVIKCLNQNLRLMEIPSQEKARAWGVSKLHTLTGLKFVFSLIRELYF